MKRENAEVISEALLSMLNRKFSETSKKESDDSLFGGLAFYRKRRRILSEEEILQFWKRNVMRSKVVSLCALVIPFFSAFLLFQGVLEATTVCWVGLGGLVIYAFCQLLLIEGLERLLGTWKATSFKETRKNGKKAWKFVDASELSFPTTSRVDNAEGASN